MRQRLTRPLSYSNVMATIAVFIALGGGAYALTLPKNSVGPRQLKTNAVTGQDALESSFGQVPSAAHADSANSAAHADSASSADSAGSAANATNAAHAESANSAGSATTAATAANAANADKLDNLDSSAIGLGFFTGRVKGLEGGVMGTKGSPPTGLSTQNTSTALVGQDFTLSPGLPIAMRDLSVLLNNPVGCSGTCGAGENVTVHLDALDSGGSTIDSLSCTMIPGQDSCSAAGPSATIPARSRLRIRIVRVPDSLFVVGTDAMFSWRATAP